MRTQHASIDILLCIAKKIYLFCVELILFCLEKCNKPHRKYIQPAKKNNKKVMFWVRSVHIS
jgi:hypothetical protein